MSYKFRKVAKLCHVSTDSFYSDLELVQAELGMTSTQAIKYTLRRMLPIMLNQLQHPEIAQSVAEVPKSQPVDFGSPTAELF
ncbi:MAG: hypothetical protein F6K56_03125 [Moorea sp. SIO3G5]|nr:hypothetical protein [Moorena sp. SIO3G5]